MESPERPLKKIPRLRKAIMGLCVAIAILVLMEIVLALIAPDLGWEVEAPMVREQIEAYLDKGDQWSDREGIALNFSVYRDDFRLLWALKPMLDETVADFLAPFGFGERIRFGIRTNSLGFRADRDFEESSNGALRVGCFGDSHCFGWGLDSSSAWPLIMERILAGPRSGAQALNFGVPGYSSAQGLRLLGDVLDRFEMDAAVIAFGFNDNLKASRTDSALLGKRSSPLGAAAWAAGRFRTAKLISVIAGASVSGQDPAEFRARRVPAEEYEANLLLMAGECRKRGIGVVFMSIYNGRRESMRKVAESLAAAVVDADRIAEGLGGWESPARDREEAAEREKAASVFGSEFLDANPKYRTHIDAAHYNGLVHLHAGRAAAEAVLKAAAGR